MYSRKEQRKGKRKTSEERFRLARSDVLGIFENYNIGEEIEAKRLREEAEKRGISSATLYKHLTDLVDSDVIKKILHQREDSLKTDVFYATTKLTKFERMMMEIHDLMERVIKDRNSLKEYLSQYDNEEILRRFAVGEEKEGDYTKIAIAICDLAHKLLYNLTGKATIKIKGQRFTLEMSDSDG